MELLLAAFTMGLLGSGHCLGMCGGISAALAFAIPQTKRKRLLVVGYNLGRVFSYGIMGLLVGGLVAAAPSSGLPIARVMAGVMLILTGLYIANIWRLVVQAERLGGHVWRRIKPLGDRLLPVDTMPKALLFGAIWGWLPCGLVYSALIFASAQANSVTAASAMLAFGAGTLPSVIAGGLMAAQIKPWLQRRAVQRLLGAAYIAFGAWTIYGALGHGGHHHHAMPASEVNQTGEPSASEHEHRHPMPSSADDPESGAMEHSHHHPLPEAPQEAQPTGHEHHHVVPVASPQ